MMDLKESADLEHQLCHTPPLEEFYQVAEICNASSLITNHSTPVDLTRSDKTSVTENQEDDKCIVFTPVIPPLSSWALTPPPSQTNSPVSIEKSKSEKSFEYEQAICMQSAAGCKKWQESFMKWLPSNELSQQTISAASPNQIATNVNFSGQQPANRPSCSFDNGRWYANPNSIEVARCSTPSDYFHSSMNQHSGSKFTNWDGSMGYEKTRQCGALPANLSHMSPVQYINHFHQTQVYSSPSGFQQTNIQSSDKMSLQDSGYSSDFVTSPSFHQPVDNREVKSMCLNMKTGKSGTIVSVPKLDLLSLKQSPLSVMMQNRLDDHKSSTCSPNPSVPIGLPSDHPRDHSVLFKDDHQDGHVSTSASRKRKLSGKSDVTLNSGIVKRARHNEPLKPHAIQVMNSWYEEHFENPYPNKQEKDYLAKEGGISVMQVKSWFANKRNRSNNTKPKVLKKQREEKLLNLCHEIARNTQKPSIGNAYIIQQLSAIISEAECH